MALTNRQKAFVEAYLANGFNATQAAITAGYSAKTAYSQGSRLLRNVEVQTAIQARMKDLAMSADEAMLRLSQQGRGRVADFLGLSVAELKEHPQSHLLHKVKVTTRVIQPLEEGAEAAREETVEYEIYNAQSALTAVLKEQHLRAGEVTDRFDIDDSKALDARDKLKRALDSLAERSGSTPGSSEPDG